MDSEPAHSPWDNATRCPHLPIAKGVGSADFKSLPRDESQRGHLYLAGGGDISTLRRQCVSAFIGDVGFATDRNVGSGRSRVRLPRPVRGALVTMSSTELERLASCAASPSAGPRSEWSRRSSGSRCGRWSVCTPPTRRKAPRGSSLASEAHPATASRRLTTADADRKRFLRSPRSKTTFGAPDVSKTATARHFYLSPTVRVSGFQRIPLCTSEAFAVCSPSSAVAMAAERTCDDRQAYGCWQDPKGSWWQVLPYRKVGTVVDIEACQQRYVGSSH
jgi:hypothetical protein